MTEIPMPEMLEPDYARQELASARQSGDADQALASVGHALEEACAYARSLWRELDTTRGYLLEHVARGGGEGPVLSAESLLRTDDHWAAWARRYAAMYSALCGPHGDEGLGESEAVHEANEHGHLRAESPPSMSPRGT